MLALGIKLLLGNNTAGHILLLNYVAGYVRLYDNKTADGTSRGTDNVLVRIVICTSSTQGERTKINKQRPSAYLSTKP